MQKHILITGTNSGFGRLSALALARGGHRVFATMRDIQGRNREPAEQLRLEGGGNISVVEMNLESDADVGRSVADVLAQAAYLDVVVNNAGAALIGLEETLTTQQWLDLININLLAPHRVFRAAAPSMRARKSGLFIQISSAWGRVVVPLMGAYCATKAAFEAMSDAYRYELKPTGVEVTIVQPGTYPTEIGRNATLGAEQEKAAEYGLLAGGIEMLNEHFARVFSGPSLPNAQDVADAVSVLVGMSAGSRPARVVVDPMTGKMVEGLNRAHTEGQNELLRGMGMSMLADA